MTVVIDGTTGIDAIQNGTVSQPKVASGVGGTGPAFSAYRNGSQTITVATETKVQINTEEFDTNSNFDPTTNYRFTPTVAGYYQVNGAVSGGGSVNTTVIFCSIYKNGSAFKAGSVIRDSSGVSNLLSTASALIYFNGSTDYIELYAFIGGSGTITITSGLAVTYFQASLVRAA
jgi:hypothetical protein